jgi:hypothetical protein
MNNITRQLQSVIKNSWAWTFFYSKVLASPKTCLRDPLLIEGVFQDKTRQDKSSNRNWRYFQVSIWILNSIRACTCVWEPKTLRGPGGSFFYLFFNEKCLESLEMARKFIRKCFQEWIFFDWDPKNCLTETKNKFRLRPNINLTKNLGPVGPWNSSLYYNFVNFWIKIY